MARHSAARKAPPPVEQSLEDRLAPLIIREIAAIGGIDAAISGEQYPDYVLLYRAARTAKQANVEQMTTLIRMQKGVPPETGGLRRYVLKTQTGLTERIAGTTATLQAMRLEDVSILERYTEVLGQVDGLAKRALRKALGRTLINIHLLTAHIAKRNGSDKWAGHLPHPLDRYFANEIARACMRCHLDRPGTVPALERSDPHPYTYICAGCHQDVRAELPADLASQVERWPEEAQKTRMIQHALSRPSMLNAIHHVLHPLSGIVAEPVTRAEEKAAAEPPIEPLPPPTPDSTPTLVTSEPRSDAEADYVGQLFDYHSARRHW
jgi:hypothetical protein